MLDKVYPSAPPTPPPRTKKVEPDSEKAVNIFEVLEDRYAFEGFNNFVFFCFIFIVTWNLLLALPRGENIAGQKNLLRSNLIPSNDMLERTSFNTWGIGLAKDVTSNPAFFGDKFQLMRMSFSISETLCNHSKYHLRWVDNSIVKGIQHACPSFSAVGKDKILSKLKSKYKLHGKAPPFFSTRIYGLIIPIYLAELKSQNRSEVVKSQLEGLERALTNENKALRLHGAYFEVLNMYTGMVYTMLIWIDDVTQKTVFYNSQSVDTIPRDKNIMFIFWVIILGLCLTWLAIDACSNCRGKVCQTKKCVEKIYLLYGIPCFLFLFLYQNGFLQEQIYMEHPIGSVETIEETSTIVERRMRNNNLFDANMYTSVGLSLLLLCTTFLMLKHLSWHSGTSILVNTISYALSDLMDTLVVIFTLLGGFGAFGYGVFGLWGGSYDFSSFGIAVNTAARLAFGLYDYDMFMSDGYGQGYDGMGLGVRFHFKYAALWLSFLFLSTIIVNILIAVISDGFELHKDKQRVRTRSGETFIKYAYYRLVYVFFRFFSCCKSTDIPQWARKMQFASSKDAKLLLRCCDVVCDGNIFDEKIQQEVFLQIIKHQENESDTYSEINPSHCGSETIFEYFSCIRSPDKLRIILFEMANRRHGERDATVFNGNVHDQIWKLYAQTDTEKEDKEKSAVAGNHVRAVVQPLEDKLKHMEEINKKMESKMEEMNKNINRLLEIIEKKS
eukprot:g15780.t1